MNVLCGLLTDLISRHCFLFIPLLCHKPETEGRIDDHAEQGHSNAYCSPIWVGTQSPSPPTYPGHRNCFKFKWERRKVGPSRMMKLFAFQERKTVCSQSEAQSNWHYLFWNKFTELFFTPNMLGKQWSHWKERTLVKWGLHQTSFLKRKKKNNQHLSSINPSKNFPRDKPTTLSSPLFFQH